MLIPKEPYFMKNKGWYYYDVKTGKYKLTNKAPKKAINSYNEYYKQLSKENDITLKKQDTK